MRSYKIGGMSCAACSSRVEKAVGSLSGVDSCSVNLLTNTMSVEGSVTDAEISDAVNKAGYTVVSDNREKTTSADFSETAKRLIISVVLNLILMYFGMGYTMWHFPVPFFLKTNPIGVALVQLILAGLVLVVNRKFFISGFKAARNLSPNMDTLVSLGSGISYIYSIINVFIMTYYVSNGIGEDVSHYLHDLYFESSAMILTLITLGKTLEAYSKGKTTSSIEALINLAPKTAIILEEGREVTIPSDNLKKGDIFILKPGMSVPADGIVTEGTSSIDESALTGESIPSDKTVGCSVTAATVNLSGYLVCRAEKVGEDTTLASMIKMVNDAAQSKAPIAKVANKVSAVFVPFVLAVAVVTMICWLISGADIGFSVIRGISVLVISCPCALGLATPVAIMVGNGTAARNGVLFKTAEALEETGRANTVVLDKTGTVTEGKPKVTDIYGDDTDELIKIAYSLEIKSEHPLAKAITEYAKENSVIPYEADEFRVHAGNGLEATTGNEIMFGGKIDFVKRYANPSESLISVAQSFSKEGKTPLYFGKGNKISGIIAVSDSIREDSAEGIALLKQMGISVVMLTGDNKNTANAVAKKVGITKVVPELLPDEKVNEINELRKTGKVIMAGDGINDAPALTVSDIGMAIGAGTDIAIDSADVVLVRNSIRDIAFAIKLSRAVLKNIKENLFWAFCYNIIGVPLAAGVFINTLNLKMNPVFGAAAMSISSFIVVMNALRLNTLKSYSIKEKKKMEVTLKIEGMMCPHCEARVKQKLEELDGVVEVIASHEKNTAVIKLEKDIAEDILVNTVEAQGYKVIK